MARSPVAVLAHIFPHTPHSLGRRVVDRHFLDALVHHRQMPRAVFPLPGLVAFRARERRVGHDCHRIVRQFSFLDRPKFRCPTGHLAGQQRVEVPETCFYALDLFDHNQGGRERNDLDHGFNERVGQGSLAGACRSRKHVHACLTLYPVLQGHERRAAHGHRHPVIELIARCGRPLDRRLECGQERFIVRKVARAVERRGWIFEVHTNLNRG